MVVGVGCRGWFSRPLKCDVAWTEWGELVRQRLVCVVGSCGGSDLMLVQVKFFYPQAVVQMPCVCNGVRHWMVPRVAAVPVPFVHLPSHFGTVKCVFPMQLAVKGTDRSCNLMQAMDLHGQRVVVHRGAK